MREVFEFRLSEERAKEHLPRRIGKLVGGWIRVIEVNRRDPLFQRIGQLELRMKVRKRAFFLSWDVRREYTKDELHSARFFAFGAAVRVLKFEDVAINQYDESEACAICGAGAPLRSPLAFKRSMKSKFNIARTLDGEPIVSTRVRTLFEANQVTGCEFSPVYVTGRQGLRESGDYFHLRVIGGPFEIAEPTQFGIDPFDPDVEGEFRCKSGHKYGLSLLSEIHFKLPNGRMACDLMHSSGFVGDRRGILRPVHLMISSARLMNLLRDSGIRMQADVAHRVDE